MVSFHIPWGRLQEELTVKKGDHMAFSGVLAFAMVAFYAIQQALDLVELGGSSFVTSIDSVVFIAAERQAVRVGHEG